MSQFLTHVYGQEKLKRELKLLMENHRVPHTMIFYGDNGLGKTTAAFDFADFLTESSEKIWVEIEKIKSSKSEKLLENLKRDRVWYIRPMGMELKIDQFRAFMEEMASFDEKVRVCIIDDAQKMNQYAANSFLKTLEEPVENLYFILVTSDINALLPTIVSRGERFPFFPLMENEFYCLVETKPEEFNFSGEVSKEAAFRISEGNPGIARDLCGEKGMVQLNMAMKFWETVTTSSTAFSSLSAWTFKEREDFLVLLRWVIIIGRDLMIGAETTDDQLEKCMQWSDREKRLLKYWTDGRAIEALAVLQKAESACRRYISTKNIWDMILIQLQHIQKGDYIWNR